MKWNEGVFKSLVTNEIIDIYALFCSLVLFLMSPLFSITYAYIALENADGTVSRAIE